jgi:hypothetical protein
MTAGAALACGAIFAAVLATRVGGRRALGLAVAGVAGAGAFAASRDDGLAAAAGAAALVAGPAAACGWLWPRLVLRGRREAGALALLVVAIAVPVAGFAFAGAGRLTGDASARLVFGALLLALTEPATVAVRATFHLVRTGDAPAEPSLLRTTRAPLGGGEVIGILERGIVFGLAVEGEYDALAFVFAAKALARHKQLDDKDFAEYFLIGTLLSAALAIVAARVLIACAPR